jgi:hypothetical protein
VNPIPTPNAASSSYLPAAAATTISVFRFEPEQSRLRGGGASE